MPVAWIRAYHTSNLPLPVAEHTEQNPTEFKATLIRAEKLQRNWTSSRPQPTSVIRESAQMWIMFIFRSRFLVTLASSSVVCWDLQHPEGRPSLTIAWGASLQHRPSLPLLDVADIQYKDTKGILIAYTSSLVLNTRLRTGSY